MLALLFASAGTAMIFESYSASENYGTGATTRGYSENRNLRPVVFGVTGGVLLLVAIGSMARAVSITNR